MTKTGGKSKFTGWLTALVLILVVGNLLIYWGRQNADPRIDALFRSGPTAAAPDQATSAAPSQAAAEAPQSLSGPGNGNTPPLNLAGGAYDISLTTKADCLYYFTLRDLASENVSDLATREGPGSRENTVYAVPAGEYYVEANTGPNCGWSLTMTPR